MGLKESKKFAIGSQHENSGGKFEILDRWYEEETNTIMLKYKYLEDGRIETNKEVNVTASEWKWRRNRGLAGNSPLTEDRFAELNKRFDRGLQAIMDNKASIQQLKDAQAEQQKLLVEMLSLIRIQQKQIETLINDKNVINKLIEKI